MYRICFGLFCGCTMGTEKGDDQLVEDTSPDWQYADCDTELPNVDWTEGTQLVESVEGIEEELAAIDLSELPDPVDISGLLALYKGFVAYALEIDPKEIGDSLSHADAEQAGELGSVVLAALLLGQGTATGIDFEFFRRGFHRYYTCSRNFPLTLSDFMLAYGEYSSDDGSVINSIAKCGDRRLINSIPGVYIAESIVTGPVRETEILLEGQRADGQLEFLVYDSNENLTTRTQFPTIGNGPHVVTASPYTCMSCHFNADTSDDAWGFDVLLPTTGPCAQ
jgi:hypothetical protein